MTVARGQVHAGARAPLPKMKFHEYLANQIEMCGKRQNEIAFEIGYEKPNIITMFKKGHTKVPINKIGPLARSIGVDPARLLRMALREYAPEMLEAIEDIMGAMITSNEREILASIREVTGDEDPKLRTAEQKAKLKDFAESLL